MTAKSVKEKFKAFGELEQALRTEKDLVLELGAGKDEFNDEGEEVFRLDVASYGGRTDLVFNLESLGNGQKLPFEDESFDKVRAKQVLEHIENLEKVFEEVYRVLKENGKFIVEVPHRKSPSAYAEQGEYGHCNYFNEYALLHFGENDWGIQNDRLDCSFSVEKVRTFYNWETGRLPNPFKFYVPEKIRAVYVKSEEGSGFLCDSFWKSLLFKVIRE